MEKRIGW